MAPTQAQIDALRALGHDLAAECEDGVMYVYSDDRSEPLYTITQDGEVR